MSEAKVIAAAADAVAVETNWKHKVTWGDLMSQLVSADDAVSAKGAFCHH